MRKQRGSITIITLVTVLFMLAFLISTFMIVTNRRQAQAQKATEMKQIYEENLDNIEEIYEGYFADETEIIPIYTAEQLLRIATNKYIFADNKIFYCSANANYSLKNDIEFKVEDYIEKYPEAFNEETGRWINISEQVDNGNLIGDFYNNNNKIYERISEELVYEHAN